MGTKMPLQADALTGFQARTVFEHVSKLIKWHGPLRLTRVSQEEEKIKPLEPPCQKWIKSQMDIIYAFLTPLLYVNTIPIWFQAIPQR